LRSDAEDTQYVYGWRLEQEAALRVRRGAGMTNEQVIEFVDGCMCTNALLYYHGERKLEQGLLLPSFLTSKATDYPAYELFSDALRRGLFEDEGRQLRLIVGKDRRVKYIVRL
jgi:D-glycerate 3-kinase